MKQFSTGLKNTQTLQNWSQNVHLLGAHILHVQNISFTFTLNSIIFASLLWMNYNPITKIASITKPLHWTSEHYVIQEVKYISFYLIVLVVKEENRPQYPIHNFDRRFTDLFRGLVV